MTLYRHSSLKIVCGLNFKSYKVNISLKTFLGRALNRNIIFTTSLVGIIIKINLKYTKLLVYLVEQKTIDICEPFRFVEINLSIPQNISNIAQQKGLNTLLTKIRVYNVYD